jgi:hypothetical protein
VREHSSFGQTEYDRVLGMAGIADDMTTLGVEMLTIEAVAPGNVAEGSKRTRKKPERYSDFQHDNDGGQRRHAHRPQDSN